MTASELSTAADKAAKELKTGNTETISLAILAGVTALLQHAADQAEIAENEDEIEEEE